MAFGTRCCWTALCVGVLLLTDVSAEASPRYSVHRTVSTFSEADGRCFPGGLTTLTTKQEVSEVLAAIAAAPVPPGEFLLWIGLKKERKQCVVLSQPLRGFRWVQDGSQETQVSQWAVEPQQTCTTVRCAALKGNFNGSSVTTWGLVPVSCKNSYQFVCKLQNGETAGLPESPATPGPEPETTEPQLPPQTLEPTTKEPEPATLRPSTPASTVTVPATSQPERPAPEPEQTKEDPGPEPIPGPGPDPIPNSGPVPGSASCHNPVIPGARSLSPDPEDSSQVRVECWSSVQLDLSCSGQSAGWRMLDGSPANFTSLCRPCGAGFLKNASGHCEDVDECSAGSPCRHTCLNTQGSFRCVCADQSRLDDGTSPCGDDDDAAAVENGDALSGVLIPVLIAVAALVVLVVVVAVTVKCCLVRRSKKHAIKKAEKMGGLDSFEAANEKAAT